MNLPSASAPGMRGSRSSPSIRPASTHRWRASSATSWCRRTEPAAPVAQPVCRRLPQQVAVLPAPNATVQEPRIDMRAIARDLQVQLKRVGCDPGATDGNWSAKSRDALDQFNRRAGMDLDTRGATVSALEAVRVQRGRICPLICGSGQRIDGDRCVAIPAAPKPPAKQQATRPPERQRRAEPPARRAPPPREAARPRARSGRRPIVRSSVAAVAVPRVPRSRSGSGAVAASELASGSEVRSVLARRRSQRAGSQLREGVVDHLHGRDRRLAQAGIAGDLAADPVALALQKRADGLQFGDQTVDLGDGGAGDPLDQ